MSGTHRSRKAVAPLLLRAVAVERFSVQVRDPMPIDWAIDAYLQPLHAHVMAMTDDSAPDVEPHAEGMLTGPGC